MQPMQSLKTKFENEVINKVAQKKSRGKTEESIVMKTFKYFDLDNDEEFQKSVNMLGIISYQDRDLTTLFNMYDDNQNGLLEFKELIRHLYPNEVNQFQKNNLQFNNERTSKSPIPTARKEEREDKNDRNSNSKKVNNEEVKEILEKVRDKLANRGVRGLISIARTFRIIDDNNSRSIDFPEFKKACKDFRFDLNDREINLIFKAFDSGDGAIDYEEFVAKIRTPMNSFRLVLVNQAFNILDKNGSGTIDYDDIKDVYNAKKHPEVKAGRKTEEEVLLEFLETFEANHNSQTGNVSDHIVTKEEFKEYYQNVSNSIDDDRYFELMMNNCWQMNDATTKNNSKKGWKDESQANNHGDKSDTKTKNKNSLQESFQKMPVANYTRVKDMNYSNIFNRKPEKTNNKSSTNQNNNNNNNANLNSNNASSGNTRGYEIILDKCRERILARGGIGIIGLSRQFRIFDDNNSRTLEYEEFLKACKDFRMELTNGEIKVLFNMFDTDQNGSINYDEFIYGIRGEMNETRKNITLKAFKKLDRDNSGVIDINDVKTLFNCKYHPEVKSGKKSEEDVYGEFLESFEMNHQGRKDRKVTKDEFLNYYNSISASIDDDNYFKQMMNSVWQLEAKPNYANNKAWTNKDEEGSNNLKQSYKARSKTPTKDPDEPNRSRYLPKDYKIRERLHTPDFSAAGNTKLTKGRDGRDEKKQNPFDVSDEKTDYQTSSLNKINNNNLNKKENISKISDSTQLTKFRNKLASRGSRGILNIRRFFNICDSDGSKNLSFNEFETFCVENRMGLDSSEIKKLFLYFDRDGSGEIDCEEFLRGLIGEMNVNRKKIVKRVFEKMDRDNNGVLDIFDLKGVYNAKYHPDVRSGKKTEDEILGEFLDTFEYHFSLSNQGKTKDRVVTLEEFYEYYNNISMAIDNDKIFEQQLTSVWNLDGNQHKINHRRGYKI